VTCIVADSGPLIMFGRSDLLGLVRDVAGDILVPATVFAECTRETVKPGVAALIEARSAGLLAVVSDPDPDFRLPRVVNLDAGEIEALALARQRDCPVLMDESLGRKVAARYGIAVIGSAGILLAAKERRLIPAVAPVLTTWREWGYFLSPRLLDAVLLRAGEDQ
jgi:predicted nucleic acid-binding protein